MLQTSQRIEYLDVLRIAATFAVIFLHVSSGRYRQASFLSFNWYIAMIYESLVRWAVPIFIMISGAMFLNPDRVVSLREIYRKRIPRLLLAYIFWWIFYSVFRMVGNAVMEGAFSFKLGYLLPHFHLWFLPMIIVVYALIPLLRRFSHDEKLTKYALALWMCYVTGQFLLPIICQYIGIDQIPQISPLFAANQAVGYAGYFLLGYYLFHHSIAQHQCRFIYLLGTVGLAVTIAGNIVLSLLDNQPNEHFFSNLSLHTILVAIALFVFIKQHSHRWTTWIRPFSNHVRKDLFGIYLTHAVFLSLVHPLFINGIIPHFILSIPIFSMVIFILSLYTTKTIRIIPFFRKFVE
ncbi:MAG: acyltransferase family protein [Bacteroidales bacterium]|nr:acyltransferase family protein [Bacteroidales bacterium]